MWDHEHVLWVFFPQIDAIVRYPQWSNSNCINSKCWAESRFNIIRFRPGIGKKEGLFLEGAQCTPFFRNRGENVYNASIATHIHLLYIGPMFIFKRWELWASIKIDAGNRNPQGWNRWTQVNLIWATVLRCTGKEALKGCGIHPEKGNCARMPPYFFAGFSSSINETFFAILPSQNCKSGELIWGGGEHIGGHIHGAQNFGKKMFSPMRSFSFNICNSTHSQQPPPPPRQKKQRKRKKKSEPYLVNGESEVSVLFQFKEKILFCPRNFCVYVLILEIPVTEKSPLAQVNGNCFRFRREDGSVMMKAALPTASLQEPTGAESLRRICV